MNFLRLLALWTVGCSLACLAQEHDYPLKQVSLSHVRVTGGFWQGRLDTNARSTLQTCFREMDANGTIRNFEIAAGRASGSQSGVYPFLDTDLYKSIEAASHLLLSSRDVELERSLDSLVTIIRDAQEPDGYLYTARTNKATRLANWAGPERWSKPDRSHELYNAGHLFEAAVAHFLATGKHTLLDVARRKADLIVGVFGPQAKRIPPGHQEIEIGLVKLYRVTGERKYLDLARFFLEERGHARDDRKSYGEYAQDHKPIFEQDEVVGHAVRVPYMGIAMTDLAALTGDRRYVEALDRLWGNMVEKKMYLIGGLGATGFGEGFEGNYDLPNFSAYNETCTSVANALWNHRLFLLHRDGKYLDVFERALYNGLLAGVSRSGDRFFYPNPLASRGYHQRSRWFDCACCPPNVARFLGQFPGFVFATQNDSLYVNLFVESQADIPLGTKRVKVRQQTDYPWSGEVELTIDPDVESEFTVLLRIPGWAMGRPVPGDLYSYFGDNQMPTMTLNGKKLQVSPDRGFVAVRRSWKQGDRIRIVLPMPVRHTLAHPNVDANRGRVALERGPLVYCLEGTDQVDGSALHLSLAGSGAFSAELDSTILDGIMVVRGNGFSTRYSHHPAERIVRNATLTAIPYFAWANRGPSEMTVWIPEDPSLAEPLNGPSRFSASRISSSAGYLNGEVIDSSPAVSDDTVKGSFVWNTERDTAWIQLDFPQTEEVSSTSIYWRTGPDIIPPASWSVVVLVKGKWEAVYNPEKQWGTAPDTWNNAVFETVRTKALRVIAVLHPRTTTGILGLRLH